MRAQTVKVCGKKENMKRIRWSQTMRREMYKRLCMEIGPHYTWDAKTKPAQKRLRYQQIIHDLAEEFGGGTTAVQQQINFATTTEKRLINQSHISSFIMNKSAALETGFIRTEDLPNTLLISN
jgi:hypothetical protein